MSSKRSGKKMTGSGSVTEWVRHYWTGWRKFNDLKKVEVKNGGQKVALKRGSTKGHNGYFFNPKDVLTANPSKYVFVI